MTLPACKKGSGGKRGKSERLRWVDKPTSGSTEGKTIKIPDLGVTFDIPDVLYVYKSCEEPSHTPEGPDKAWVPVLRCSSPFGDDGGDSDEWDDDDSGSSETRELTIYVTEKGDTLINERATTSMGTQYQQAGFEVEEIGYFDEYLAKPGRRGIEVRAHTLDPETGYPDQEIRRFLFPRDDVLFIAHVDYPYGDDRSGINSDWERILWYFEFVEDLEAAPAQ
ncbi:hypothetical protein G6O69_02370 [Pseudenhygromyxa sp. WMMC2535]|uniref:hypothetical protein n=1 Tax=Pseudenhygromyxa sp. WMMC2535 TaxID=2712867 RepID=UPI0015518B7D|nr:hypothetical protein [Pseudenhygromyxa sp. WMMC2535]NVB36659.1 hypothetical protein [Pseudenhygromyxa sp. WMMC2535]